MTLNDQELVDAILAVGKRENWRVDRPGGACQWFGVGADGIARPISLTRVWSLARRAARATSVECPEPRLARLIQLAQARVPLLTHEEWLGPHLSKHPQWRAA